MNLDDLEEKLGGISPYQVLVILLTGTAALAAGYMSQSAVIFSAVPAHRCALDPISNEETISNFTESDIVAHMIPKGDSCHRFDYNLSTCLKSGDLSCVVNKTDVAIIECDKGYVYDETYFKKTTVSEWNLVCGRTIFDTLANSLYFAGVLVGSLVFGPMMDWFGRKAMILFTTLMFFACGIAASFVKSFWVYAVLRFLVGTTSIPCFLACFTYACEMSGKRSRSLFALYLQGTNALCAATLSGVAYLVRNWRDINIFFSCVSLPYVILFFFLPRSPRWLLAHGKENEAKQVVLRYVKSKNTTLKDSDWDSVIQDSRRTAINFNKEEKVTVKDLLKTPYMRAVSVVVVFLWFVVGLVFYGLILNVGKLAGDPYVNRALNGIVELLAILTYVIPERYLGRRTSTAYFYSLAGTCCLLSMFLVQFSGGNAVLLQCSRWIAILGKYFTCLCFYFVYQHTAELFPTSARGTGIGMGSVGSRFGSIIMPWTLEIQMSVPWVTQTIFGVLGLVAGASALLLPETKNCELMTTIQQTEKAYEKKMKIYRRFFNVRSAQEKSFENMEKKNLIL